MEMEYKNANIAKMLQFLGAKRSHPAGFSQFVHKAAGEFYHLFALSHIAYINCVPYTLCRFLVVINISKLLQLDGTDFECYIILNEKNRHPSVDFKNNRFSYDPNDLVRSNIPDYILKSYVLIINKAIDPAEYIGDWRYEGFEREELYKIKNNFVHAYNIEGCMIPLTNILNNHVIYKKTPIDEDEVRHWESEIYRLVLETVHELGTDLNLI